jgi:hypothetical protein
MLATEVLVSATDVFVSANDDEMLVTDVLVSVIDAESWLKESEIEVDAPG